jgi:hypothetical protein
MLSHHRNIGLAVSPQGITAVEIEQASTARTISHVANLAFTADADLEHPEALGRSLKSALRAGEINSSRCVIGLSSAWLATREKSSPATDAQSIRGIASIAVERDFASGSQELMFDYSTACGEKCITMLLAAVPRKIVDQLLIVAKSAGLDVSAITASIASLAMADGVAIPPSGRLVICLGPDGAEIILQNPQGLRLLRHIKTSLGADGQLAGLASDCRRILAMASSDCPDGTGRGILIWNTIGIAQGQLETFADQLGCGLQIGKFPADLGIADVGGQAKIPASFAPAAALACRDADGLSLDFLHSKLAAPKKSLLSRRLMWIAAIAAGIVGLVVYLALDVSANQKAVAELQSQLATLQEPLHQAKDVVEKTSFAGSWYDGRPPLLDCMLEVAKAFPDDPSIWATSLTIEEEAKTGLAPANGTSVAAAPMLTITLHGKASNDNAALGVLDRLKSNPRIIILKPLSRNQAGGNTKEVSFNITLGLRGVS